MGNLQDVWLNEKNQYAEQCIEYVPICFKNKDIDIYPYISINAFNIWMEFIGSFN